MSDPLIEARTGVRGRPEGKHLPVLDGIRGIAILLVLLAHTTVLRRELHIGDTILPASALDRFWFQFASVGWVGVDVFFVLSGFLITGILADTRGRPHFFRNFYARRVLRIFPLYYLVVFLSLVVLTHVNHPKAQNFGRIKGDEFWYWTYLSNFSIAFRQGLRHGILDVSWSLAIEEQFYLLWPALVFFLPVSKMRRLALGLVIFSPLLRLAIGLWNPNPGWWFYAFYLTPCRMDGLALGAWLALTARQPQGLEPLRPLARRLILLCPLLFIPIWVSEGGELKSGFFKHTVSGTLICLTSGSLLLLAVTAKATSPLVRALNASWLRTMGKFAYALYLLNMPMRAIIRDGLYPPERFLAIAGSHLPGQLIFYVVSIPFIFAGAWLSWHLFEKHFLQLKRFFPSGHIRAEPPVAEPISNDAPTGRRSSTVDPALTEERARRMIA